MRATGVELSAAFAEGVLDQGLDVVDLGMASTDLAYFAAGHLDAPAAMFTASHNPAQYNGIKICLRRAPSRWARTPASTTSRRWPRPASPPAAGRAGAPKSPQDLLRRLRRTTSTRSSTRAVLTPLKIVADTANGMGGLVVPAVFAGPALRRRAPLPPSSTAPSRTTPPTRSTRPTSVDLKARVLEVGADVGLAFDGDADRVFLVDEHGAALSGSTTTAIVAAGVLAKGAGRHHPAQPASARKAVAEVVRERGGTPDPHPGRPQLHQGGDGRDRRRLRGEHSAHYYFRNNFRADSGAIAALVVLEQLALTGLPLSGAAQAVRALRRLRRDQLRGARRRSAVIEGRHRLEVGDAALDRLDGLTGGPRRVVVQPAGVEHRTPAAPQPGGRRPRPTSTPKLPIFIKPSSTSSAPAGADGASASEPGGDGHGAQPHGNKEA